jgi:propionyl-CoA carboxylase alpha chain/3-methylcrotonyl-CoA carboxylase alpha subunit
MEARLYAEDPNNGFLPSTGVLDHFGFPDDRSCGDPEAIRVDAAVTQHSEVTPFYDPMISKLIAHADTRAAAIEKLREACEQVAIWPVKTNAGFLARCLADEAFKEGDVDTSLIAIRGDDLAKKPPPSNEAALAAANELEYPTKVRDTPPSTRNSPWVRIKDFRLNAEPVRCISA